MNSFTFFDWSTVGSILMLLAADFIIVRFVIPLQVNQAQVKNGLIKMREQLLLREIIGLIIINSALSILIIRLFFLITGSDPIVQSIMMILFGILILIFCAGFLVKAVIDDKIYHQDFSPKSVKKHERIDRLEKAEVRREEKAK